MCLLCIAPPWTELLDGCQHTEDFYMEERANLNFPHLVWIIWLISPFLPNNGKLPEYLSMYCS